MMTPLESVTTVLSALVALVAVLLAAWFVLRWMGKKMPGQTVARHIKVLDRVMLGQDKCLLLVQVAGQIMLIGMTSGSAVKLCDVNAAELAENTPKQDGSGGFPSILQSWLSQKKNGAPTGTDTDEGADKWQM